MCVFSSLVILFGLSCSHFYLSAGIVYLKVVNCNLTETVLYQPITSLQIPHRINAGPALWLWHLKRLCWIAQQVCKYDIFIFFNVFFSPPDISTYETGSLKIAVYEKKPFVVSTVWKVHYVNCFMLKVQLNILFIIITCSVFLYVQCLKTIKLCKSVQLS